MTEDSSATTSSTPTDPSKDFATVAELGAKIVEQFGQVHRDEVLVRWLAYRIAQLLRSADRGRTKPERETAAREAGELITRLWSHRTAWPDGWPPRNAAALLERLVDPAPYWSPAQPSGSRWLETLGRVERIHMLERQLLFDAALLETDLTEDAEALERLRSDLEADEVRVVESLTSRRAAAIIALTELLAAEHVPSGRSDISTETLRQRFAELASERATLVQEALRASESSSEVNDGEPAV